MDAGADATPYLTQDVTPEMITEFLPANTLPEADDNPHPIHLLIDPASGKTKDYLVCPFDIRSC